MTANTIVIFRDGDRTVKEIAVESYNVVSGDRREIELDGILLNEGKDGTEQLESRIQKNLTMMTRIITDQFMKAKDSTDPRYTLLKLAPVGPSEIEDAMRRVKEVDLSKVLPLILITLNEYRELIDRRDHDALLKVIEAVASTYTDKAQMGIGMAKNLLEDTNIVSSKIIDKLYLCINNVHKLTLKYYKSTLM